MTFQLTSSPLNPDQLKRNLLNQESGALSTFEGVVRNHNDGQKVLALKYEADESLALAESKKIFGEVRARFNVHHAACVHRIGRLEIGETAVWVGVSAAHRDDAFKACRFIIDEIKKRLPIWKKEFYADGHCGWVNCAQGANANAA